MNNNLNPNISPTGLDTAINVKTGVKKLNKVPILIISIVLFIILLGLGYATVKRTQKNNPQEEKQGKVRSDGERLANDFISKLYQSSTSPKKRERDKETQEPKEKEQSLEKKSLTPQIDNNPLNSSSTNEALEKRLLEEKLALEKYKRELYKTALTAPTKVKLQSFGNQGTIPTLSQHHANPTTINPAELYTQIAKAYKGEHSSKSTSTINNNERFLQNQQHSYNYLNAKKTKPLSPYEMKTGTLIPSVLITQINSDLPGPIKAQVRENVFDTATGEHLLIPQGSTLIGTYSSNVQYGQNRVLIAFNRIIFPDGQTLNLGGMNGINQQGAAGFNDQVNNHYLKIFGSAILMGAITGGIAVADTTRSDQFIETNRQKMLGAFISELGQVAQQMIQKNMNIAPTLEIRAGYRFNIFTTQDIILEPLAY